MQGQQTLQETKPKKRNQKIAVISLTTASVNDKNNGSPDDSEQYEDEEGPDNSAQP